MFVDLHIHSFFSDGTLSPEEIVIEAKNKGLKIIAITDHDNIEAFDRFNAACNKNNMIAVRGVELTTKYNDKVIHILAYGFEITENLRNLLDKSRNELLDTSVRLIERMSKDYQTLSIDDYNKYEHDKKKGAWKGVHYLLDKGITSELLEGTKYYQEYGCDYLDFDFPSVEKVCAVVKAAGGYTVLAHPSNWYSTLTKEELFIVLNDLKARGIEGIECYYPSNSEEITKNCVEYCKKNDWIITAGSDGHGEFTKTVKNIEYSIGAVRAEVKDLNLKFVDI